MIRRTAEQIRERAERMIARIPALNARIEPGESVIGGGATPEQSIPTWLVVIERPDVDVAERKLRRNDPPVISRILDGRLVLDLRTVFEGEEEELDRALQALS